MLWFFTSGYVFGCISGIVYPRFIGFVFMGPFNYYVETRSCSVFGRRRAVSRDALPHSTEPDGERIRRHALSGHFARAP